MKKTLENLLNPKNLLSLALTGLTFLGATTAKAADWVALQTKIYYSPNSVPSSPAEINFPLNGDEEPTIMATLYNPDNLEVSRVQWNIEVEGDKFYFLALDQPNPFVRNSWSSTDFSEHDFFYPFRNFNVNTIGKPKRDGNNNPYALVDADRALANGDASINEEGVLGIYTALAYYKDSDNQSGIRKGKIVLKGQAYDREGNPIQTLGEKLPVTFIPAGEYVNYLVDGPRVKLLVNQKNGEGVVRYLAGCNPFERTGVFEDVGGNMKIPFTLGTHYWRMVGSSTRVGNYYSDIDFNTRLSQAPMKVYTTSAIPDNYVESASAEE